MTEQEKDLYRQVAKYCAYRERAEFEVHEKLKSLDVSDTLCSKLIAQLKKDKFLNNKRFARYYAQGKFLNNKWGKIKIKQGLREKQISSENIDFAIAKIDHKEYLEVIKKLIVKKAASLKAKQIFVFRKKIVEFLRTKGYEADIAWDLVKESFPD